MYIEKNVALNLLIFFSLLSGNVTDLQDFHFFFVLLSKIELKLWVDLNWFKFEVIFRKKIWLSFYCQEPFLRIFISYLFLAYSAKNDSTWDVLWEYFNLNKVVLKFKPPYACSLQSSRGYLNKYALWFDDMVIKIALD